MPRMDNSGLLTRELVQFLAKTGAVEASFHSPAQSSGGRGRRIAFSDRSRRAGRG